MNELFKQKKNKRIQLCEDYFLSPDSYKGLVLTKEVIKTRKKLDKDRKKTGEIEQYTDLDHWYFPKLSQTLSKYLQLKTLECDSVEELLETVLRVEKMIENL